MSRRVELPDEHRVCQQRDTLLAEAEATGVRPSVIALARRLGLTNTTFWRHYPHIAREIADARSAPVLTQGPGAGAVTQPSGPRSSPVEHTLTALRRDNQGLREQLDLASATIARLALDNSELRRGLEHARGVRPLRPDI